MSDLYFADSSPPPPEDDDGEDLDENYREDYRSIAELDEFDAEGLDDAEYGALDMRDRRAAERAIDERDRREGRRRRRGHFPTALEDEIDEEWLGPRQRGILDMAQTGRDDEAVVNLDDYQGSLRVFLEKDNVRREIKSRFRKFLTQFSEGGNRAKYPQRITQMCQDNKCSLEVSFHDLSRSQPVLAIWIADMPTILLDLFDEVAMEVAKYEFSTYDSIHPRIHVRVSRLPLNDQLRELRELHLNTFIQVSGVVTRRTNVFPQLRLVKFDCLKCSFVIGPFAQQGRKEIKPPSCPDCQSSGPFRLNETETVYRNYQKIVLQESPGSVPAGRIPRSRDVILVDDLCDSIRPGEQIKVTGVYKNVFEASMNAQQGFPVFSTVIESNHIIKEKDYYSQYVITDEDRNEIIKLSKRNDLETIILASIAPSIYGHDYIKRAIAYALFGGQEKKHKNKHRVRGDINILILGDPGTAKSQFLRYVENVAFRAVYATGKGASAVGLTASVRRDPISREWTLEGGALVLADHGVCLIDEFDKMNDQDRTSIHEAMEQQSISISKAGIVATLQARCAVIAAANPLKGRYDGSLTFVENVDLTDPILSRFDVLAVVRDRVDPVKDEMLADFVVGNHIASHPAKQKESKDSEEENGEREEEVVEQPTVKDGQISQEMLRKYIMYAKSNTKPKLDNINRDKIAKFYADLRQKSMEGGGIPIAVRHIESILRLSEARARLHLREYVRDDDVDMAIRVMLESFIDTQKQSVQSSLRHHFQTYLTYQRDSTELLLHILEEEVNEEMTHRRLCHPHRESHDDVPVEIDCKLFQERAEAMSIVDLREFYRGKRFRDEGFVLARNNSVIVKHFR